MSNNRIIYNGEVLIDLTQDTITPNTLLSGETAHVASGEEITGTLLPVLSVNEKEPDPEGNVQLELQDLGGDLGQYVKKVEAPGYSDILTHSEASSLSGYVRKVYGSRLITTAEASKLSNIDANAEVNVQSDWAETDVHSDTFIQNKPELNFLPNTGGQLSGELNLKGHKITSVSEGTNNGDVVNKLQLDQLSAAKQNRITGAQGQFVGFNISGNPIAQAPPVSSVNSKTGEVILTPSDIGALPDDTIIPTNDDFTLSGLGEKSYNSLTNKPTALSEFSNDTNYITAEDDITGNAATATSALKDSAGNIIVDSYLKLTGGTLTSDLDMGFYKIRSLTAGTEDNDVINKKQLDDAISGLGTLLIFKGTKPLVTNLPTAGNAKGDVWIVLENSGEYVWSIDAPTGNGWEKFGSDIDLSAYLEISDLAESTGSSTATAMTQKATTDALALKQDSLSGTAGNILVYNNNGGVDETTPSSLGVTGIKGSAQSTYQKGNVSIDAADVGALASNGTAVDSLKLEGLSAADFMLANNITPSTQLSLVTYDNNGLVTTSETVTEITNAEIDALWA